MQVADGLVEHAAQAFAGQAHLAQQRAGEGGAGHAGLAALAQPAVPQQPGQAALDLLRLRADGLQLGIEQALGVDVAGQPLQRRGAGGGGGRVGVGGRCLEGQIAGHQRQRAPAGAAIALVAAGRGPGGDEVAAGEAQPVLAVAGQRRAHRQQPGVGAGHHRALAVQQHDGAGFRGRAQLTEDAAHLVVEAEGEAQHADQRAGLAADGMGIQQPRSAAQQRQQARMLHVAAAAQGLGQPGCFTGAGAGQAVVQPGQHVALRRQHDDVVVDRILGHVLAEAPFQRLPPAGVEGACGALLHMVAQHAVGGQEADVGGALEQVAHQDVDGHLGPRLQPVAQVGQRAGGQRVQQRVAQRLEGASGIADVGHGAAHLPQQGQRVPHGLQALQVLAVFLHRLHAGHQAGHFG
ncbi:hypothetical protein [Aquincola sp. J276]|uniref:hypothetical protein n=1 Tax=Aquincola sp. J276 TaxID=2898432 RepID=UPI002150AC17|nr:hypothetical protein [Aquincola sp. J276]MCR5868751.1 hypothetical protein [Aquincola sp. J276]